MEKNSQITIIKSNGDKVAFEREKLIKGLRNSGAGEEQALEIAGQVEQRLYEGISTKKIYQIAYGLLKKKSHRTAGRYRLKKAIFDLGPSGFLFELFIARLFEHFGYQVKSDQVIQGKCVQHEVDVVATNEKEQVIVECKFHSDFRSKTNVQVPLYIDSRFKDIRAGWAEKSLYTDKKIRGYVVTNARFTQDAIQYAECVGLGLISWDYPEEGSLKYYADMAGLHPVTSLHSLNKTQKRQLLDEGIVICSDLIKNTDIMRKFSFDEKLINRVLKEAELLSK